MEAFGYFLQYQYTRDYQVGEEQSSDSDGQENTGEQLLRHARVYTLAEKLGLPGLKSLAHKKIHMVNGTPSGELAYARYVYTHTRPDDAEIRRPIAAYWALRGHVLRQDLETEFKSLSIEVPEFTFDVLTIMMDRRDKEKLGPEDSSNVHGSARKRRRG